LLRPRFLERPLHLFHINKKNRNYNSNQVFTLMARKKRKHHALLALDHYRRLLFYRVDSSLNQKSLREAIDATASAKSR
jgi:hypothetical protein